MQNKIKNITLCLTLFCCVSFTTIESFYTISVTSIDGVNKPLSAYQNKKVFVIVLPTVQSTANTAKLQSIDSLCNALASNVQIIGVPAYEFGFTSANKQTLNTWYRTKLRNQILITDGMYIKKMAGIQQHALFAWLTNADKNGSFNNEVEGVFSKYLVWDNGNMVANFAPNTRLNSTAIAEMFTN
jgi:glutathione peroxidase